MPRRRGPSCRPTTSDSGGTSLMNIRDLVLVDGVRTPMIDYNGPFAEVSAIDLAAHAARALLDRLGVEGSEIDHAVVGNALQTSPDAIYGARHVALKAGLPQEVPALTVNRLCGSGIQSVISGSQLGLTGEATTCLVGGMENMSQTPHVIWGARRGFKLGQGKLEDLLMVALFDSYCGYYMAQTSNNLARDYGITRAEQDEFALLSQRRAGAAWASCRLSEEGVPVEGGKGKKAKLVERDDHMRPDSTMEDLAALPPAFDKDGFVTAGNASGIVDGAAMMLLSTAEHAEERGWKPLGRILGWSVVGVEPSRMGIGPAPAIRAVLAKTGMELGDLDLLEINEAFAGQILAVIRELQLDVDKLNVNGGAIALGHPLGASGTRLLITLLKELGRRGGGVGVASACVPPFARARPAVLLHLLSREGSPNALLGELGGASEGPAHLVRRCDLRDAADVWAMFAFVAEEWGALDVLVNNAGIWVPTPLADFDAAGLDETLAVNVTGSFLCAAAALPLLELSADGNVVNVTSTAGQRGEPGYSPYAASKGAMIAATRSWAVELAPRVRVNSVAPGWVDTDMTAAALSGPARSEALAGIPLGRIATPEDIAGPVVFLASPLARHVTGEVLSVNGGSVIGG